jgi:hypothetical protein
VGGLQKMSVPRAFIGAPSGAVGARRLVPMDFIIVRSPFALAPLVELPSNYDADYSHHGGYDCFHDRPLR